MPGSGEALLVALCGVAPGWFALLGWHTARRSRAPSLANALVPASVISFGWSGFLLLATGGRAEAAWTDGDTPTRLAIWCAVSAAAFGLPFCGGYFAGRVLRRRAAAEEVTLLLRDDTIVHGWAENADTEEDVLRVSRATISRLDSSWTTSMLRVRRDDISLFLREAERHR